MKNYYGTTTKDLEGRSGVYVVTNIKNGKQYVGQSKNMLRRWYDHRTKSLNPRKTCEFHSVFYQAIRDEGLENFHIRVLEYCDKDKLKEREAYWVAKLDTFNNGYNNDYGGDLPCYTKEHHLEDHWKACFTMEEVKKCRKAYKNGERSKDVYEKYYLDRISYEGFQKMWLGRTWSEVMPEVFENNPHPRTKATKEDVYDIRERFDNGQNCHSIARDYKGKLAYATIYDIAHRNRFADI